MQTIKILLLGGNEITVFSRFFAKNKPRYKNGKGFYPGLAVLSVALTFV
jgi:hypothetical protein